VRGDERRVVEAFASYLRAQGWNVELESSFVDVLARRGDEVLLAEAKGRVGASMGLDVDTLYGQLLRRMTDPRARYAVVVPTEAVAAAARVPLEARRMLRVDIYEVDVDSQVQLRDDV
jgi:hypothetical protein